MSPKDRIRGIAERLQAVLLAPTREDQIVAIRELDRGSIQDFAWLIQRERGLRARLQETLRRNAELEAQMRDMGHAREKTGLRSPVMRQQSRSDSMVAELRQLSREMALEAAEADAFEVEDIEWFEETQD